MNYAVRRRMQDDLCMLEWNIRKDNSNRDTWDQYFVVKYSCHHIIFEDNLIKTKMNLSKWCLEYAWSVIYLNYNVVISILQNIVSYWYRIDETSLRTCHLSRNDSMLVLQAWSMRFACKHVWTIQLHCICHRRSLSWSRSYRFYSWIYSLFYRF
jgi:hypothetical protein